MARSVSVALLMLCATAAVGSAQDSAAVNRDLARLRGTFVMLRGEADGQLMDAPTLASMKRVSEGNVTTVTMSGQIYIRATIAINPSATPKAIDYDMTGGFTAGKKQLGIYRMAGDTVTFCFGSPDAPRPKEFASPSGSGITCSIWARQPR